MTAKLIASCLLVVASVAAQETPTVELNGGMQAQLLSLGRKGAVLTAAVKITNKGQDHVFLLLYGAPSAADDAGVRFDVMQSVGGVAFCPGPAINPPTPRLCVGLPKVDDQNLFPLPKPFAPPPSSESTRHGSADAGAGGCGFMCQSLKSQSFPLPPPAAVLGHFLQG